MKKNIAVVVVMSIVVLVCAAAFAQGDTSDQASSGNTQAAPAAKKVNNTICPVSGKPVDMSNPVTAEYNGKIYNFCCTDCVAQFKADPEKYISKMQEPVVKKNTVYNKFGDVPSR